MQNRVAHDAESKMSGLNDARMNGTDSDFRNALALNLQKAVLTFRPGHVVHRVHHWVHAVGPIVMENQRTQIGVAQNFDAVLIVEFSLMPCRCRRLASKGV